MSYAIENRAAYDRAVERRIAANRAKGAAKRWAAFIEAHDEVEWGSLFLFSCEDKFVADVLARGLQYGSISDAQLASIIAAPARKAERAARFEALKTQSKVEAEALAASGVLAPTGRVVITGTVQSTKYKTSNYGTVEKMVVTTDAGWKVYCSVPADLEGSLSRGDVVEFTATLTPSDDDPTFAFGSRPAKARVLGTVALA